MTRTFNLLDEPWIDVRLTSGATATLSLREVISRAGEISALAGDVATQDAAVLRLLLAVLYRTHAGGDPVDTWERLWSARSVGPDAVERYLQPWTERFDLLHPSAPFFQVADLRTAKGGTSSLGKIVADIPPNDQFFTTRSERHLAPMTLAEAARWVVHAQAYDPSGIKSGAVGDDRVKGGRGYPIGIGPAGWLGLVILEGATLAETLLLNLDLRAVPPEGDSAVWERPPQGAHVEERSSIGASGPADLLTWQSRRIRLEVRDGAAVGVVLANGDPSHPRNTQAFERMTAWRKSKAQEKATKLATVYMPRAHQVDRAVWRGLGGILGETTHLVSEGLPLGTLEWLAALEQAEAFDGRARITAHAVGIEYGSNFSVIDDVYDDAVAVRAVTLADRETRALVADAVHDADLGARATGDLAKNLALAAGGSEDGVREAARERVYHELDRAFRAWLAALEPTSRPDEPRRAWQRTVRSTCIEIADELIRSAGVPALTGRVVPMRTGERLLNAPLAEVYFRNDLRRALTLTTADTSTKEAS